EAELAKDLKITQGDARKRLAPDSLRGERPLRAIACGFLTEKDVGRGFRCGLPWNRQGRLTARTGNDGPGGGIGLQSGPAVWAYQLLALHDRVLLNAADPMRR